MPVQFGTAQTCVSSRWPVFKTVCTSKKLRMQYEDEGTFYEVFALDGPSLVYRTQVFKAPSVDIDPTYTVQQALDDQVDFEANFKALGNRSLDARTAEGIILSSLDTPKEGDKKMVVTISPASEGWKTWITGAGDDMSPPPGSSGRGEGTPLVLNFTGSGVQTAEFAFNEPVEVHDGQITWKPVDNWSAEDKFSVGVDIAATTAIPTGSGGNCVAVPTGLGYSVFVPYPGGDHYIDLSAASPIPSLDKTGFWDVDYNTGEVKVSVTPGQAAWHLLDVPLRAWILRRVPMGNPLGTFDIDAYKTEYLHPKWRLMWKIEKTTPTSGSISGWVFVFRRFTD